MDIRHRSLTSNGIAMHVAEAGAGPTVLLCHGFPESWYSWRHQLVALAAAGYHAVAPDMRGYGQTGKPAAIDRYTLCHLVGDMVGLLDALNVRQAVVAGHDWGAPVAWHCALFRPDRFRAVIGLSVPYRPPGALAARPTSLMPRTADAVFYQLYFQEPGIAEAELERDPESSIRTILYMLCGDRPPPATAAEDFAMVRSDTGLLGNRRIPPELPAWIGEADLAFYAGEFRRTGFRGGLNWYRNIDRNWELLAPFSGAQVMVPALFIVGDRDLTLGFKGMDGLLARLPEFVPNLRARVTLPGCGHWTQQERPEAVNAEMIKFLKILT